MESLINLRKEVGIVLTKKKAPKVVAQVGMADDVSGSARDMHLNGTIQRLINRLFAVGFTFDDNAILDAWAFDTSASPLEPITEGMFNNYVQKYIIDNKHISKWQGTKYAPVLRMMQSHYNGDTPTAAVATPEKKGLFGRIGGMFGKSSPVSVAQPMASAPAAKDPAFITFVTDGDNTGEEDAAERQLEAMKNDSIFIMFIGITDQRSPEFRFLKKMAAKYPNVDFFDAGLVDKMSSADLYDNILTQKFLGWYSTQTQGA